MNTKQLVKWEWAGETKMLGENLRQCYLSATTPKRPDLGSNPGHNVRSLVTNCLRHGTDAIVNYVCVLY
jgi:hypothetical protein